MGAIGTLVAFGRQLQPFCRAQPGFATDVAICLSCILGSAVLFLMQPLLLRSALDLMFSDNATYAGLYWECFLMLANYIALHTIRQYGLFKQGIMAQRLVEDVRVHAFAEMIHQGHLAVERRGVGAAQSMLTSDVTHIHEIVRGRLTDLLNGRCCLYMLPQKHDCAGAGCFASHPP